MPSCSIVSVEILIPAVSPMTTGYPPTLRTTSTTSLVVPGTGDTIAASLFAEKFLSYEVFFEL